MSDGLSIILLLSGAVIYFSGIGMYLWGLVTLKTMFGVSSSVGAELYADHQLITQGPFAFIRHPMYLGVILASWGGLLIYRIWAMMIFVPMALTILIRAWREEKLLEEEFGDEWREYTMITPMWIPRIRKNGI